MNRLLIPLLTLLVLPLIGCPSPNRPPATAPAHQQPGPAASTTPDGSVLAGEIRDAAEFIARTRKLRTLSREQLEAVRYDMQIAQYQLALRYDNNQAGAHDSHVALQIVRAAKMVRTTDALEHYALNQLVAARDALYQAATFIKSVN